MSDRHRIRITYEDLCKANDGHHPVNRLHAAKLIAAVTKAHGFVETAESEFRRVERTDNNLEGEVSPTFLVMVCTDEQPWAFITQDYENTTEDYRNLVMALVPHMESMERLIENASKSGKMTYAECHDIENFIKNNFHSVIQDALIEQCVSEIMNK